MKRTSSSLSSSDQVVYDRSSSSSLLSSSSDQVVYDRSSSSSFLHLKTFCLDIQKGVDPTDKQKQNHSLGEALQPPSGKQRHESPHPVRSLGGTRFSPPRTRSPRSSRFSPPLPPSLHEQKQNHSLGEALQQPPRPQQHTIVNDINTLLLLSFPVLPKVVYDVNTWFFSFLESPVAFEDSLSFQDEIVSESLDASSVNNKFQLLLVVFFNSWKKDLTVDGDIHPNLGPEHLYSALGSEWLNDATIVNFLSTLESLNISYIDPADPQFLTFLNVNKAICFLNNWIKDLTAERPNAFRPREANEE
ncbi:hypothetical protein RCL1_005638 [Eukaryota sp. TZLM3-RCL]